MILARLFDSVRDSLRQRFAVATFVAAERNIAAQGVVSSVPPSPLLAPSPANEPAPELTSPSPMRLTAVEILRNEPNLTAAELASRAGVTLSYAGSLVRRKRLRPHPVAAPVRAFSGPTPVAEVRSSKQIVDAAASGTSIPQIAEQLSLVPGEVEFILKIDRLKKNLKV